MEHSWRRILEQPETLLETLQSYELRPCQIEMANRVADCLEEGSVAVIEAPTGIGKTLAYLLPALEIAQEKGWRVLVSTHTIPLQRQILHKDLPLAQKLLDRSIDARQLVGLQQYLCLRNYHRWLYQDEEGEKSLKKTLHESLQKAAPLPLYSDWKNLPEGVWQQIRASEDCTRQRCSFYQECAYFKDRRLARHAQVVVVNHHLLAAQIKRKIYEGPDLLGPWDLLIIDEAHHFVDALTDQLSFTFGEKQLSPWLARFWVKPPQGSPRGWLALLKESRAGSDPLCSISIGEIAARFDHLWQLLRALQIAITEQLKKGSSTTSLLLPADWSSSLLYQKLQRALGALASQMEETLFGLEELLEKVQQLVEEEASAQLLLLHQNGSALVRVFKKIERGLEKISQPYDALQEVIWLEQEALFSSFHHARFDLSETIYQHVLEPSRSVLFCSATLGSIHNFEPIRSDLGLLRVESRLQLLQVESPFDWKEQAELFVCEDMPLMEEAGYQGALLQTLQEIVEKSRGRVLVLETSTQRVEKLALFLRQNTLSLVLAQSEGRSREDLLEEFAQNPEAILIGADSFWEGIDLAGESLACVVLVKLPFDVPSDPFLRAKAEALYGKKAFWNYLLPRALVRFQQGIGRLLRHRRDRGSVICLDRRLVSSPYSAQFLKIPKLHEGKTLWKRVSKNRIASLLQA